MLRYFGKLCMLKYEMVIHKSCCVCRGCKLMCHYQLGEREMCWKIFRRYRKAKKPCMLHYQDIFLWTVLCFGCEKNIWTLGWIQNYETSFSKMYLGCILEAYKHALYAHTPLPPPSHPCFKKVAQKRCLNWRFLKYSNKTKNKYCNILFDATSIVTPVKRGRAGQKMWLRPNL